MNKTQLDAVKNTLTTRVINHYKEQSDKIAESLKPSAEAKALLEKFNKIADEVEKFNEKLKPNKLSYQINMPGYGNSHADFVLNGYTNVYNQNSGSTNFAPEIADKVKKALTKVEDYVLALTLGKKNLDELDDFLVKLLD